MSMTASVFHVKGTAPALEGSPLLKLLHRSKVLIILSTADVSHDDMSTLNDEQLRNMYEMSCTVLTSHVETLVEFNDVQSTKQAKSEVVSGVTGDPARTPGEMVRLEQPEKQPVSPAAPITRGPHLLMLRTLSLSPPALNDQPVMVPVI